MLGACSRGFLTTLPAGLSGLARLAHLDLSFNSLETLPACVPHMRGLSTLLLSYNRLSELPDSLGALPSLSFLSVSHNCLRALPPALGSLSALQRLDLSENLLDILPPEIGDLSSLTELNLASNRLQGLPISLGKSESCSSRLPGPDGERPSAAPWFPLLSSMGAPAHTGLAHSGAFSPLWWPCLPSLPGQGGGWPRGSSARPQLPPAPSGAAVLAVPYFAQQSPDLSALWPGPPPAACPAGSEGQPASGRASRATGRPLCAPSGEPPGQGSTCLPQCPR